MKIFMAIGDSNIVPLFYDTTKIKLNYLISYAYLEGQAVKLTKEYRQMIDQLFLDSGAFTSSTGKAIVTISEYLKYLKRYGKYFGAAFNLDDDFTNPEKNYVNQVTLEKGLEGTGVRPVPVVHDTENPFEELQRYANQGHTFIAIGSNKPLSDDTFKKIKETYPDLKLHMFGNLRRKMLFTHKPYSSDSTEYAVAAGFSKILYWDPIEKKEYKISVGSREGTEEDTVHFNDFKKRKELEDFLFKTFKFEYKDLLPKVEPRWIVNMYFFHQLEDAINQS